MLALSSPPSAVTLYDDSVINVLIPFQYWPSRGTETYGVMCVTLTDTQELATYVIRTFQLQRVSSAHVRHPSLA